MREEIHVVSERVDVRLMRLAAASGPPVILVPGLAATHLAFELHGRVSLAEHLARQGRTPWAVDFYVTWRRSRQDAGSLLHALEMALAELQTRAGVSLDEIDGIGHSLGGMLLLALAADGVPFRRLVTLASGVDFRVGDSHIRNAVRLVPLGRALQKVSPAYRGLPLRRPAGWIAPVLGRGLPLTIERDQFHPGTTDSQTIRRFFAEGVRDLSIPLLMDLASLFTERGLRLNGPDAPLRELVRELSLPVLMVSALQDRQCPPEAVRDAVYRIPDARLLEVGARRSGEIGYGHLDLLTGRVAPQQVFEPVADFLTRERLHSLS